MLRFFTRKKVVAEPEPIPTPPPAPAAPPAKEEWSHSASQGPPGGWPKSSGESRRRQSSDKGKERERQTSEDEASAREKRQVTFVSPAPTPGPGLFASPPAETRSPSPPLPSLPAIRHASSAIGNGTVRGGAGPFHHLPIGPAGPSAGTFRSVSAAGTREGGSSGGGSQNGHGPSTSSDRPGVNPISGTTSPTMSFASSYVGGRRGSGGIRPSDTWGGTVIGAARDGEDIYQPLTWSEMNDVDLVENLSGRERTRQEVLWEIVASEERYVDELLSLKENYVDPLLHPFRSPPLASAPFATAQSASGAASPAPQHSPHGATSPSPSASDFLPIAARFARTISTSSRTSALSRTSNGHDFIPDIDSEDSHVPPSIRKDPLPPVDNEQQDTQNNDTTSGTKPRPRFPRPFNSDRFIPGSKKAQDTPFPSSANASSTSLVPGDGRASKGIRHYLRPPASSSNKLHKSLKDTPPPPVIDLPESLRIVLGVIGDSLLRGHQDLSVKLKEKYLEQFPLVRDLTSVWAEQTWIIQQYSVYVLHLEKALSEVEAIFADATAKGSSVSKADRTVVKTFMRLEEKASDRGECGLAICLSKPFQRLLKYPLLFQNLLYHTDASTHEYESAQSMAIAIDGLVRSIEDEKVSEEERDRARDVWARIEDMNEKALMIPSSQRTLISEEPVYRPPPGLGRRTVSDAASMRVASPSSPERPDTALSKTKQRSTSERLRILKGQKSFRRLSDMVAADGKEPSLASKRDVWLVVFSDVVLRCQRIGVTRLTGAAFVKAGKAPKKTKGRQSLPGKERNLYRFLKIEKWETHPSLVGADEGQQAENFPKDAAEADAVAPSANGTSGLLSPEGAITERTRKDSAMSFSYDLDEPKPVAPNVLKSATNKPAPTSPKAAAPPRQASTSPKAGMSAGTRSVIAKQVPAANKFSNRLNAPSFGVRSPSPHTGLRSTSSAGHYRYEAPTSSTLAKARTATTPRPTSPPARAPIRRRAGSSSAALQPPPSNSAAARRRAGSGPSSPPATPEKRAGSVARQPSQDFSEFARYVIAMPPGSQSSR